MSILETLYILFETDASDVKKGIDSARVSTKKLQTELSSTNKISNYLEGSFTRIIKHAAGAFLAFTSISSAIHGIKSSIEAANTLDDLSKSTDESVEKLNVWGNAVAANGGTVEGFQQTVKSMTAQLASFSTKGKSALIPYFQELGVKITDSSGKVRKFLDILPDLAVAFQKIGKSESLGIGQKLGLDIGTIMLLQKGKKEVDDVIKRQKELGVITKEDAEISAKFNNQWNDTGRIFGTIFTQINSTVLPILTNLLEKFSKFTDYVGEHAPFFKTAIIGMATAITAYLLPSIISAVVAFAPFLLIGAAVAAVLGVIALVVDDVTNYLNGNNSVLGELIKKWPVLGVVIKKIGQAFSVFIDIIKSLGPIFANISNFIRSILSGLFDFIKSGINGFTKTIDKIVSIYNKIKKFFGIGDSTEVAIKEGKNTITIAGESPLSSQSSGSIVNSSKSNQNTTSINISDINIQTQATDANSIAGNISGSLEDEMRNTLNNFSDGVAI